jgi:hypothetical protein
VFDGAHRAYNEAIGEFQELGTAEGRQELFEQGVRGAVDVGQKILNSDDPRIANYLDSQLTADGQTFRQSLQKAITDFDGEALGDFISGNIGAAVEGAAKAEEEDPIF